MTEDTPNLPKKIGMWTRQKGARTIDGGDIFEYMNGAGELYLAYRFQRLDVYKYTSDQQGTILVELYTMKTSHDAFGLLSMDWGGVPVRIQTNVTLQEDPRISPPVRALYGMGLLRLWADTTYARVMADRETPASKETVLSLGRIIGAVRKRPQEPALLKDLPETVEPGWKLRRDRIVFFRSHLVLNSVYYLSHKNILKLDHTTEAVTVPYEIKSDIGVSKRVQVLYVRYASAERAREALSFFHSAYLHDQEKALNPSDSDGGGFFFNIEDGWLGYQRDGKCVAFVFESTDQKSAQLILKGITYNATKGENVDGE